MLLSAALFKLKKTMPTSPPHIIDSLLNDNFDSGAILRGRDYFKNKRVKSISISNDDRRLASKVLGHKGAIYRTHIHIVNDDFISDMDVEGECSCYVGFNCKHVVATLLEAKKQKFTLFSAAQGMEHEQGVTPATEAFNQWFDEVRSRDMGPVVKPLKPGNVFYVLQKSPYSNEKMGIQLFIANRLKNGTYGKAKKYNALTGSHRAYLNTVDEEIIMALNYINDRTTSYNADGNTRFLEGNLSSKWLETLLKTERCFWGSMNGTQLKYKNPEALILEWQQLHDGCQEFTASIKNTSQINKSATTLVFLDKPWYINTDNGQCGIAESTMPSHVVKQLLEAPPVPPEMTKKISEHLIKASPNHTPTLPEILNKPTAVLHKMGCSPIMKLGIERIPDPMKSSRYARHETTEIDAPIAKIFFNYEGTHVPFSIQNKAAVVTYMNNGHVYSFLRDFEKERAYLLSLNKFMHIEPVHTFTSAKDPEQLHITSLKTDHDFLAFARDIIPQLEQRGWRIERNHELFISAVYDEDISWYSEINEQSEYDYFSFKMGIVLNNEKINILPIIADIIKTMPADKFNKIADDFMMALPLPNSKTLFVPFIRIKPMLNILIELYDMSVTNEGSLSLKKHQAALLFEMHKSFGISKMRWFGTKRLQVLGEKLAGFTSIKTVSLPLTFKATLRGYQQEGVNWLQFLRKYHLGGILADDMGLGKTVQTLAHLAIEKNKRRLKNPCLIIAPTSLMANWRSEAARFTPNLKVLVFHGDGRHKHKSTIAQHDIVLTTYPLLARDKDILLAHEYYYLILDEAQYIKNNKALSTQIVQQLKAEHRLCVTGTPMENNLGELWSLFNFLMPGFLGDTKQFKRLFRTPIEKHDDDSRRQQLALRIKPFMLRRQKNAVIKDLPEKTHIIRTVELEGPERDLYESIRLSMEKKVRDAIKDKGLARSHIIILDALLKLRQTCCHSRLLKLSAAKKAHQHSAKLNVLKKMLPTMVAEGRKILLFSQFTTMLSIIEEFLTEEGLEYVKLTGSTKNRSKPIDAFQKGCVPIFLISLKAGGTGLNLTAADTVIHYDPWWNPAVEDQATDRAHRIGQDKSVFVYKLVASGTVEDTIQTMQQKKRALMEGLFSQQPHAKISLSSDDLADLFKPLET
jgi:superfamily II DNA or RNA helicase